MVAGTRSLVCLEDRRHQCLVPTVRNSWTCDLSGKNTLKWETFVHASSPLSPQIMPPKRVLPIHTNSITQPLHAVHTGHVSATFSVGIYCVRAGLTPQRAVSTLLVLSIEPDHSCPQRGRFRTARTQRQLFRCISREHPCNPPRTEGCMINSIQHGGGCRIHDLRTRGNHQTKKKIPGVPAGAVGCRIQDPGNHGSRWWKTADFPHSAGCAPQIFGGSMDPPPPPPRK